MPVVIAGLIAGAALLGAWLFGSKPRGAASSTGLALGVFAALACFGATALAVRRRVRKLGKLGTFQRWTQVHIALGAVGFFAALLHANFALHGWLTATLLVIFGGVFLSGFAGQMIYTFVPPALARIEGDKSMLVEDVWAERRQLEIELAALSDSREMIRVAKAVKAATGGLLRRLSLKYKPEDAAQEDENDARVQRALAELPPDRRPDGRRVAADVSRIADHKTQLFLYRMLRVWLALHISATGVLLSLLIAHIFVVLVWFR
jgi:hypothetical protein